MIFDKILIKGSTRRRISMPEMKVYKSEKRLKFITIIHWKNSYTGTSKVGSIFSMIPVPKKKKKKRWKK